MLLNVINSNVTKVLLLVSAVLFAKVLLMVLTLVFTSTVNIRGELLHIRLANIRTAANICHTFTQQPSLNQLDQENISLPNDLNENKN